MNIQKLNAAAASAKIAGMPRTGSPFLVAIDGRCAAGKTTLAQALRQETGWGVVHMDHFFLRPAQRTEARLAEPGGNVDRERFLEEVLLPLQAGRDAVYRPYDCHSQSFSPPVRIEAGPAVIIEGSYSCHPALWDAYHLRVFLDVSPQKQLARIEARNGSQALSQFRDRWIPLEERYFAAFGIGERCALCFELEGYR